MSKTVARVFIVAIWGSSMVLSLPCLLFSTTVSITYVSNGLSSLPFPIPHWSSYSFSLNLYCISKLTSSLSLPSSSDCLYFFNFLLYCCLPDLIIAWLTLSFSSLSLLNLYLLHLKLIFLFLFLWLLHIFCIFFHIIASLTWLLQTLPRVSLLLLCVVHIFPLRC